ncbi:uncharacterized protein LOC143220230 [Lasioglossum baleicum]|uniref:uncharacterized protein LOC143220230 n=1 Tax=Lasioglossum baleicum TaxID=434251 RepID=UPI003FCE1AC7
MERDEGNDEGDERIERRVAERKRERQENMERDRRERVKKIELEGKLEDRIDKRLEELEKKKSRVQVESGNVEMERRLKEVEMKWEKKEREIRRRNIIIKGLEIKDGEDGQEEVKKLLEVIGEKFEVEEVKKGGRKGVGKGNWAVVKLATEEQKRRVMTEKKRLAGRTERIEDDLTFEERSVQWRIKKIMEKERRKGKMVKLGYMKLWIDGIMWKWDEREKILKNGEGNEWGEEVREGAK